MHVKIIKNPEFMQNFKNVNDATKPIKKAQKSVKSLKTA